MKKRILILILLAITLSSCGLFKNTQKHKQRTVRHITERGVRVVQIPMDSIVYKPIIRYTTKDTTIVVENKNLIIKTRQKRGRVTEIKAIQKPKESKEAYEQETNEHINELELKSDGLKFSKSDIIIAFVLLSVLVAVNNLTKKI